MVSEVAISEPATPIAPRKKYHVPQRPSIQELRQKYDCQINESPTTPKPKSPKLPKQLKVKEIASMFNSKISQIIWRDTDVNRYNTSVNELSPEPKRVPQETLARPLPLPRTLYNKENAPVPSPRSSSVTKNQDNPVSFVAEDVLTVKDKALLYTQFVYDMSQKNQKLGKHAEIIEANMKKEVTHGEVVNEKQESVKRLLEVLEARCVFPKHTVSCIAVQSFNSVKRQLCQEKHKSTTDKLLEEDIQQKKESLMEETEILGMNVNQIEPKSFEHTRSIDSTPKSTPCKKKHASAVPNQQSTKPMVSAESSTTSLAKNSEAEQGESIISNLPNVCSINLQVNQESPTNTVSSIESQHENPKNDTQNDFNFNKLLKPMRKKKIRRTLSWRRESFLVERNTITTTDSESDCKNAKHTIKKIINKPQALELKPITDIQPDPSFVELDTYLMRAANTPPPCTNSSHNKMREVRFDNEISGVGKTLVSNLYEQKKHPEVHYIVNSFDQGFETGSNEVDSPIRQPRKSSLFIKLGSDSCQTSVDPAHKILEIPSNFSTPIKSHGQQNFVSAFNESGVQQQLFSPISMPLNIRRLSVYDNESRRTSIAMEAIREDHPLEQYEIQLPRNLNNTDVFLANDPSVDMVPNMSQTTSSFWIKSGEIYIALGIHKNDPDRLKLLYEIFSQKSCDTKDIHFGIDDHKFSVHNSIGEENISKRLPQNKETSHYWFSTGGLVIPFSGKRLTPEKIQSLFHFIKASVEENGVLHFGVDLVEFSNVPKFWNQAEKYSMESNYSMLVGLQSGNSNGLEGRSKYDWPHSKPVPVKDLDQYDFESDDFEVTEFDRPSISSFGSNLFDFSSLESKEIVIPRNSEAMMSPESFCKAYENEPLDHLFENKHYREPVVVSDILNTLETQDQLLSSVEKRSSCYNNPAISSCNGLDALRGTPEYLIQLKNIVSDINNISCNKGFKDSSLEELERYMLFLSCYADICLNNCSSHMDTILDVLLDNRAVFV